jgi:hypothetical protein
VGNTSGQVETSFDCETVFSLNKKYYQDKNLAGINLPQRVAEIAGIERERKLIVPVYTGKFIENNIEIEKYFLENNLNDYALPVYILKKDNTGTKKLIVWFHPRGKQKILDEPLLPKILEAGYTVVSADLPGTGELHDPEFGGDAVIQQVPFNYTLGANLIGKSIPGIQAEAIDLLMQFVEQENRLKDSDKIALVEGLAASPFLHYAVSNNKFSKAAFLNFPEPFINLVETRYYNPADAFYAAPGSLPYYDLPDLLEYLKASGTEIESIEKLINP